ncbi:hypothetical protein Spb1_25080 [Planctopirus ephydatiae]|uniref:Carboxypeptidase regulatory-like domain-containing protein n=2 Tax=Planctopirus ephydatiae TaxID=2528019 RepID=A0A518GPV5_9PLAN|nr:hypothetical protein Spb1_25080 [Planctopirus ephydatiae]
MLLNPWIRWGGLSVLSMLIFTIIGISIGPKTFQYVPVRGRVTLNGVPAEKLTVIFAPVRNGRSALVGELSSAVTDSNGNFELRTAGTKVLGAVPGGHTVAIVSEVRDIDRDLILVKEYLPKKYHEETTLTFEVPYDGTDFANFELSIPELTKVKN